MDVWACGVILYALLCGMLPFDDDLIPNLYKKIKGGLYHLPDYLSPGASHLISSILVVDPNTRITIPEIRRHPWFRKDLPPHLAEPQADSHSSTQARWGWEGEAGTQSRPLYSLRRGVCEPCFEWKSGTSGVSRG